MGADGERCLLQPFAGFRSERVREMIVEYRSERLPRIPRIEIDLAPLWSYDLLLGGEEVAA